MSLKVFYYVILILCHIYKSLCDISMLYMVYIEVLPDTIQVERQFCAGVILTNKHILTHARCSKRDYYEGPTTILHFPFFSSKRKPNPVKIGWHKNEMYDDFTLDVPFAVLTLLRTEITLPHKLMTYINPSTEDLTVPKNLNIYKECYIVYVSKTSDPDAGSFKVLAEKLLSPLYSNDKCNELSEAREGSSICSKVPSASDGICEYGNPLVCLGSDKAPKILGIYNGLDKCAESIANFYIIYKDFDWISKWIDMVQVSTPTKFAERADMSGVGRVYLSISFAIVTMLITCLIF